MKNVWEVWLNYQYSGFGWLYEMNAILGGDKPTRQCFTAGYKYIHQQKNKILETKKIK